MKLKLGVGLGRYRVEATL